MTAAWWKEERGRRVFIDFNQNAPHKTIFGARSVRARPGAQVSTPFGWDELDTPMRASPLICRRLLVRSDSTIADLHVTLRTALGWSDEHLNRFVIHGREYGVAHIGGVGFTDDPRQVRLADFGLRVGDRFLDEYDFTDGWQHDVRIERRAANATWIPNYGERWRTCEAISSAFVESAVNQVDEASPQTVEPGEGACGPSRVNCAARSPSLAALVTALRVTPSPRWPDGCLRMIGERSSLFNYARVA